MHFEASARAGAPECLVVMKVAQFPTVEARGVGRPGPRAAELGEAQAEKVREILGEYDPKNLGSGDAKAIRQSLRDAGIPPGPGLRKAIEGAGFDAERLRPGEGEPGADEPRAAGAEPGRRGGGGGGGPKVSVQELRALKSILDRYDLSSLDAGGQRRLVGELSRAGLDRPGLLVDKFA